MNWKQRLGSHAQKRAIKCLQRGLQRSGQYAASLFLIRRLRPLAASTDLGGHPGSLVDSRKTSGEVKVVRYKQGVVSLVAGDRFIRAARWRKGERKLQREHANWHFLRSTGVADRISPVQECTQTPDGWTFLFDKRMEPVEKEELFPAMGLVLPPLVEHAEPDSGRLPASIETGYRLILEASEGKAPERLPPLKELQAAFARPLRQGFFHADLHRGNVMLCDGRYTLIDLKSCRADRVVALDLLQLLARTYPETRNANKALRLFEAEADGWRAPEIAPVSEMIDLPQDLWAGAYFYHAIGLVAARDSNHQDTPSSESPVQSLFTKRFLRRMIRQL